MKKLITVMLTIVTILVTNSGFAGGAVKSKNGYFDFRGMAEVIGDDVYVTVRNISTDETQSSKQCPDGMASVLVYVELWDYDAGILGTAEVIFLNVCNGSMAREIMLSDIHSRYSRLEVRFNISTLNGEYSFWRGNTYWSK